MISFQMTARLLLTLLVINLTTAAVAAVYEYPLRPGDGSWRNLTSHQQMQDACRIPPEFVAAMNTAELVETCLDYPLLPDYLLHADPWAGVRSVVSFSNGWQELLRRPDGATELGRTRDRLLENLASPGAGTGNFAVRLQTRFIELVLAVEIADSRGIPTEQRDSPLTIYTPHGSEVQANIRDEMSAGEIQYLNNYVDQYYPDAVRLGDSSRTYNCHSYAWNMTEGGPVCWIGTSGAEEDIYWLDHSYVPVASFAEAVKVSYQSDDHSAVNMEQPDWVRSKWGSGPVMEHAYDYCPYNSSSLAYFIDHPDGNEPNDTQDAATLLVVGEPQEGFLAWAGDTDWYALTSNQSGDLIIDLTDLPADYDLRVGTADEEIARSENSELVPERVIVPDVSPGDVFFVEVSGPAQDFDCYQPYALIVDWDAPVAAVAESDGQPLGACLLPCTPNPFNPTTRIGFELPAESRVGLRVYDASGSLVKILAAAETYPAGRRYAQWDGRDDGGKAVSSGVYFVLLTAGDRVDTQRMTLVR